MSILTSGLDLGSMTDGLELRTPIPFAPNRRRRKSPPIAPISRVPQSIPVLGVSRPIEVKIASTASEWEQAFELAASSYQTRGYETPGLSRLRFTPYHALPDTRTFVAKHEDRVVATLSVVMDNTSLGLPMEDIYPDEIATLRQQGRRLAETTTLADSGLGIREFIHVFLSLIKLAMHYHRRQRGDTPVIVVNPRHRQFYTKMLGFVRLGPVRTYSSVQNHPAEAFWIDYALLKVNAPKIYRDIFGTSLPRNTLFAPKIPRSLVRQFSEQSSLCEPEEIEKILALRKQYRSMRRW
jgi:hypothetical protein